MNLEESENKSVLDVLFYAGMDYPSPPEIFKANKMLLDALQRVTPADSFDKLEELIDDYALITEKCGFYRGFLMRHHLISEVEWR